MNSDKNNPILCTYVYFNQLKTTEFYNVLIFAKEKHWWSKKGMIVINTIVIYKYITVILCLYDNLLLDLIFIFGYLHNVMQSPFYNSAQCA